MITAIIIPAHDEAANIGPLVQAARAYGHVLVVDDSSTDDTAAVAARAGAKVMVNGVGWGKEAQYGDGFRTGLRWALNEDAKRIVFMDAGGSHQPADIPALVAALDIHHVDVAIGSRILPQSTYRQKPYRYLLTQVATRWLGHLTIGKPLDYSSFRAFTPRGARATLPLLRGLDTRCHIFNPLLTYRIWRAGLSMVQVPIAYRGTNSTLRLSTCFGALWAMLLVWQEDSWERKIKC